MKSQKVQDKILRIFYEYVWKIRGIKDWIDSSENWKQLLRELFRNVKKIHCEFEKYFGKCVELEIE